MPGFVTSVSFDFMQKTHSVCKKIVNRRGYLEYRIQSFFTRGYKLDLALDKSLLLFT
jgi:hypothetical protein